MLSLLLALTWAVAVVHGSTLTVTSPQKDDSFFAGAKATIKWQSTGLLPDAPIGVEIWDARKWSLGGINFFDRDDKQHFSGETVNSGQFDFFVPIVDDDESNFYVVIFSIVDDKIHAQSEEFTIKKRDFSLTVTEPVKGVNIQTGDAVSLKWQAENIPADASLQVNLAKKRSSLPLSLSSASLVHVAATSILNTGEFSWSLPLDIISGDNYLFQVVWEHNDLIANSELFTVSQGDKLMRVLQPRSNSLWQNTGTQKTIEIETVGFPATETFNIELFRANYGNEESFGVLQSDKTAADLLRVYISVPDAALSAKDYFVRVSSVQSPQLFASSELFEISTETPEGIYTGESDNLVDWDRNAAVHWACATTVAFLAAIAIV